MQEVCAMCCIIVRKFSSWEGNLLFWFDVKAILYDYGRSVRNKQFIIINISSCIMISPFIIKNYTFLLSYAHQFQRLSTWSPNHIFTHIIMTFISEPGDGERVVQFVGQSLLRFCWRWLAFHPFKYYIDIKHGYQWNLKSILVQGLNVSII